MFWPSFPLALCVRTTRSPPVWPACICISAALPDTPSDLRLDRSKSCRQFLAPTGGREDKYMKKAAYQQRSLEDQVFAVITLQYLHLRSQIFNVFIFYALLYHNAL